MCQVTFTQSSIAGCTEMTSEMATSTTPLVHKITGDQAHCKQRLKLVSCHADRDCTFKDRDSQPQTQLCLYSRFIKTPTFRKHYFIPSSSSSSPVSLIPLEFRGIFLVFLITPELQVPFPAVTYILKNKDRGNG